MFLFNEPAIFLIWIAAIFIALSVHEYAHAFIASQLGDNTAKEYGRLTLNPISHIDTFGMLMLIFVGFGWGKPVPINPSRLKHGKWGEALVALAGPISNLILIIVFGGILWYVRSVLHMPPMNLMVIFLELLLVINTVLMFFNLIPFPPLDGSKVIFALLPYDKQHYRFKLEQKGPMILFGILLIDAVFNIGIFSFLLSGIVNFVRGIFL